MINISWLGFFIFMFGCLIVLLGGFIMCDKRYISVNILDKEKEYYQVTAYDEETKTFKVLKNWESLTANNEHVFLRIK